MSASCPSVRGEAESDYRESKQRNGVRLGHFHYSCGLSAALSYVSALRIALSSLYAQSRSARKSERDFAPFWT